MSTIDSFATLTAMPQCPLPRPPKTPDSSPNKSSNKSPMMRVEVHYPMGKNPFGDDDSDIETFENSLSTESEIKVKKTDHQQTEPNPTIILATENENLTMMHEKMEHFSVLSDSHSSVLPISSKNPFDSDCDADLENNHSEPTSLSMRLLVPPEVPSRTYKKRTAPKPPAASTSVSMEILPTEPAMFSDFRDSESNRNENIEIAVINNAENTSSPPNRPKKLSISCDNGLNESHFNLVPKRSAPPQPVPEKRQVRAECTSQFIDYPVLRREIEEVSSNLSGVLADIAVTQTKLNNPETDLAKHQKYIKKLDKLSEKQRLLTEKQLGFTNRLQRQMLEDRHADLEHELRNILAKQEHLRTADEKAREEVCLRLLVDIVEQRAQLAEDQVSPCGTNDGILESKTWAFRSATHIFKKPLKITHFNGKSNKAKSQDTLPNAVS